MKRREFVKVCSISALGIPGLSTLLTSCGTDVHYSDFTKNSYNQLVVDKSEFLGDAGQASRKYVFLMHPNTRFPICLFNVEDDEYVACLMSCTHQHCQTTVVDDMFVCPCHGARFTNTGKVIKGPAQKDLLSYPVKVTRDKIFITLPK